MDPCDGGVAATLVYSTRLASLGSIFELPVGMGKLIFCKCHELRLDVEKKLMRKNVWPNLPGATDSTWIGKSDPSRWCITAILLFSTLSWPSQEGRRGPPDQLDQARVDNLLQFNTFEYFPIFEKPKQTNLSWSRRLLTYFRSLE